MRTVSRLYLLAASLMLSAGIAVAGDIRVLSVEETQNAVRGLGVEFEKETSQAVAITIVSSAELTQKLKAGETFDALVASEAAMDELDGEGLVNPESRAPLASTGSLQINTVYEGALLSDGAAPEAARAFVQFLASPGARAQWIAARLEPIADH